MTVKYHSTISFTAIVMKTPRSSCDSVQSAPPTVIMSIASSMRPFHVIFYVKTQMRLSSLLATNSATFRFSSRTRVAAVKGRPSKDRRIRLIRHRVTVILKSLKQSSEFFSYSSAMNMTYILILSDRKSV